MASSRLLAWIIFLSIPFAASATQLPEATFREKMADSDLVVIATVTSVKRGDEHGVGSSAKLAVVETLKGNKQASIEVSTYIDISEMDPHCCDQGATYLMFLNRAPNGKFYSHWGRNGMVRVGSQFPYEPPSTLQWCKPRPQPSSVIFRGSPEALANVQSFAEKQAASLQGCTNGQSQILILPPENGTELPIANKFLRAFHEGKLPDVEISLVGDN
jgi:hypothetical protein